MHPTKEKKKKEPPHPPPLRNNFYFTWSAGIGISRATLAVHDDVVVNPEYTGAADRVGGVGFAGFSCWTDAAAAAGHCRLVSLLFRTGATAAANAGR